MADGPIRLKNWSRTYQWFVYDTNTGQVLSRAASDVNENEFRGFVESCSNGHLAVYLDDQGQLIVQWKRFKANLVHPQCVFHYQRRLGFIAELEIECEAGSYTIRRSMFWLTVLGAIDPARDEFDAGSEDLLRWVAMRANDPTAALGIRNAWMQKPWSQSDSAETGH